MKLWEGLSQDINYNVMFSQRGVYNLCHTLQDIRDSERRVSANRLNGVDGELLDTAQVAAEIPTWTARRTPATRFWVPPCSAVAAWPATMPWPGAMPAPPMPWAWT